MSPSDHDDVVRQSFRRQVGLFSGPDSPFVSPQGPPAWVGPVSHETLALEVACGAAHLAETLAPDVHQVVGVDLTPELLELGSDRLRAAGIRNVLLQEANAEALPFVDRSFDLVYCRSSLHHFADPLRAVTEMVRVCRPGGQVALSDIVAPVADEREAFDDLHRLLDPSHVRAFVASELPSIMPDGVRVSIGEATTSRLPIDIAITEQSDDEAVVAALRAEIDGGAPTGFDPTDEDGRLVVSFTTCVIQGTIT